MAELVAAVNAFLWAFLTPVMAGMVSRTAETFQPAWDIERRTHGQNCY